ncbi:histidine--tRNA ligase [Bacillaceae bacterium]
MAIQIPRGTADILPGESEAWQYIEEKARDVCRRFNYHEIRTPIFEHTELFLRGVGETTDIVEKEMYTFTDKGDRSITLRPEGTAPVVRSYVENKLYGSPQQPTKLYYIGPMFRYERPQAGRMRQFTQFGVEALGSADPAIDAEVIALAYRFFTELGLKHLHLEINSVGCSACRPKHRQELVAYLETVREKLCKDCRSRLERNPLRILDCKVCRDLTAEAPSLLERLCGECASHFAKVKGFLDALGIPYEINPRLVRGLDYYTQTAFEIMERGIGAVSTICGGGRYNRLVEELGGPDVPGIGFALSIERALLALRTQGIELPVARGLDCYFVTLGEEADGAAVKLLAETRAAGFSADKDYLQRKLKAQLKSADRLGAKLVAIIGEDELARGAAVLKNMKTGEQEEVALASFIAELKRRLEE